MLKFVSQVTSLHNQGTFSLEIAPRDEINNSCQWVLDQGIFVYLHDFMAKVKV